MADSIVRLSVEDSSFNAKIKEAAKAFATFGKNVGSAGVEAFGKFAKGVETAKVAFQGFNQVLKANALVLVSTLAIQAASAIGEMIGDWISGANDAEEAQKKLNDELDRTAQLVKGILAESDFNARIAKAAGKSTTEILQMQYKAADKAYNEAMATMMNPNIKVGTEEYNKANQILQAAEKRRRKLWEDIQVDNTARENKTGEYALRGGSGGRGGNSTKTEQTEMQTLQTRIKDLEQEYIKLGTVSTESADKRRNEIRTEIQDNEKRINQIKLLNEQSHGRLLGGDVQLPSGGASLTGNVQGIGNGLSTLPQHL
jgi:hypothetical protein